MSSLPSYRRAQIFIESILGFPCTQQYTLGMHLLLRVVDHVLVGMFLVGGVGSAVVFVVVVISFAKDMLTPTEDK